MSLPRRSFLERLAAGGAIVAGLDLSKAMPVAAEPASFQAQGPDFDLSWVGRVTGSHRCVFDCTEIENGLGFIRAPLWRRQYADTLGVKPDDLTAVVVIRHNAIPLAMSQAYWDKYGVAAEKGVKHPLTEEPTTRNPILLRADLGEVPAQFAAFNFDAFMASGGICLACNLAFADVVGTVAKADGVDQAEARKRALTMLLPGVLLQPSGVFASIRAQEARCVYLKSS